MPQGLASAAGLGAAAVGVARDLLGDLHRQTVEFARQRDHVAAAVRAAVISTQSMTASGTPVAASFSTSSPLM